MTTYPRKNEQGQTVWACCESQFGQPCAHKVTQGTEYYWTVRQTSPRRWEPQEGWSTRAEADKAAKWYRQDRHRPCVVVFGCPWTPEFSDKLLTAVIER